jgi:hypothetical protein
MPQITNAQNVSARVNKIAEQAWQESRNYKSNAQDCFSWYFHVLLQALYAAELRGGYWDALVENGWNLFHFPAMEEDPWRVVKIVTSDEHHTIGRGVSAIEAMERALTEPEWRPTA